MPTFHLQVWKYEKFVCFSQTILRRRSIDYDHLINKRCHRYIDLNKILHKISQSLAKSYFLYWSVSDEGMEFSINLKFPETSGNNIDCGMAMQEQIAMLTSFACADIA